MSYTGPGDLDTYTVWCGMRGYSAAVAATGTQKSIRIQRASDSTSQDFVILTTGAVDVASIATFLTSTTGIITTWYDQTGNGHDVTLQSGTGATYTLGDSGLGTGQPCGAIPGSGNYASGLFGLPSQPYAFSCVSKRTGATTSTQVLLEVNSGNVQLSYNSSINTGYIYSGIQPTFTVSDNDWHTLNVNYNGASSAVVVDGSSSTVNPGAGGGGFQSFQMSDASFPLTGRIVEFGFVAAAISSPSSLNTNQQYWFSAIPSGGGGFLPAWARGSNIPVIGTGTN